MQDKTVCAVNEEGNVATCFSPAGKRGDGKGMDSAALLAEVNASFARFQGEVGERLAQLAAERTELLAGRTAFEAEMREKCPDTKHPPTPKTDTVTLHVGGEHFTTNFTTLNTIPNTFFTLLFVRHSDPSNLQLDRDPDIFRVVLAYMEDPTGFSGLNGISKLVATSIAREAEFYGLAGLRRLAINCTSLVVSKDGVDTPYSTIAAAVADAVNGDRIVLLPGLYEEVVFTTKRIEICGEGNRDNVIICTKEVHPTIVFTGSGGGVLRGLTLREDSPFGVGLVEVKASASIMIDNCDLSTNSSGNAINVVDESSLHMVNCEIHDVRGSGVFLRDSATATIRNNSFKSLDSCGLFTRHESRFYFGDNRVQRACLGGVDINDQSLGTVEGNVITDCGRGGIVFYGSSHTRVKGNIIKYNEYGLRSFENSVQIINHNDVKENTIEDHQGQSIRRAILQEEEASQRLSGPCPGNEPGE